MPSSHSYSHSQSPSTITRHTHTLPPSSSSYSSSYPTAPSHSYSYPQNSSATTAYTHTLPPGSSSYTDSHPIPSSLVYSTSIHSSPLSYASTGPATSQTPSYTTYMTTKPCKQTVTHGSYTATTRTSSTYAVTSCIAGCSGSSKTSYPAHPATTSRATGPGSTYPPHTVTGPATHPVSGVCKPAETVYSHLPVHHTATITAGLGCQPTYAPHCDYCETQTATVTFPNGHTTCITVTEPPYKTATTSKAP